MSFDLITATQKDFEPFIGDIFNVESEAEPVQLTLDNIKINESINIRDNHLEIEGVVYPPRQPFALTMVGPVTPLLAPRVYKIEHAEIGAMQLLISPFRQDPDCILYEIVFS